MVAIGPTVVQKARHSIGRDAAMTTRLDSDAATRLEDVRPGP